MILLFLCIRVSKTQFSADTAVAWPSVSVVLVWLAPVRVALVRVAPCAWSRARGPVGVRVCVCSLWSGIGSYVQGFMAQLSAMLYTRQKLSEERARCQSDRSQPRKEPAYGRDPQADG